MLRRSLFLAPLLLAAAQARAAAAPLRVVASFSILADLTRQIGGERVAVRALVGADADAHNFSPRPSDVAALREAQLVVRNGLGFEPWLDRLLRVAGGKVATVGATTGITPRVLEGGHDHGHGHGLGHSHGKPGETVSDPHAWQDLANGQAYVRNIAAGLTAADPEGAALYKANAEALLGRLAALDAWVRQQIASVPEARRKVVTSHDAFGYFAAAYGVDFRAPQGVSNEGEPSARAVANLARQLKAEGITAVFIENMNNPALLDRLAAEADVRVRGKLYSDALSAEGGPAPTYEAMFRHNVGLLVPAMKGVAG